MKKNYQSLIEKLNLYNHAYYTLDKPIVTDEEYDRFYDELVSLEEEQDYVVAHSPTQRVGGDISKKFEKIKHTVAMSSLDKAPTFIKLQKFIEDIQKLFPTISILYTLEHKLDGLAIVLRYEKGYFVHARSRGNGIEGELLTAQVKTIKSIPMQISYKETVEIQGEVFFPLDKFIAYNEKQNALFEKEAAILSNPSAEQIKKLREKYLLSNPRNGAAGAVRNQDPKVTASRPIDAFFYNVPYIEGNTFETQTEMMEFMKKEGFKVNPYFKTFSLYEDIEEELEKMEEVRPTLNWDIDGMVLKVDNIAFRDIIGSTRKHPKWAIAYKFEAVEKQTPLLDIIVETGRTGKVTPKALYEKVYYGGTKNDKSTANNYDDIKRKGIKPGCILIVRRANDVIPEIIGTVEGTGEGEFLPPTHCPACGSPLEKDGVHLYCRNISDCPAQIVNKLAHFGSRNCMNIDGFSEKTAEQLHEVGLLKEFTDFYRLKVEDLVKVERFKLKKAENLVEAIEQSKKRPLAQVLFALGIRLVGPDKVERLLNHFDSLNAIISASQEELKTIDGIGESVAESIYHYFRNPKHLALIEELQELGLEMTHVGVQKTSNRFEGMTFVITGTLTQPRNDIDKYIKVNGGKTSGSISKKTSILVAGENAGSKLDKAEKLGVKIISENELYSI